MLTKAKLTIYREYRGWLDGYLIKNKNQEDKITGDDWMAIGGFIQDLFWIRKGLADASYKDQVEARMRELCDGPETIAGLIGLERFLHDRAGGAQL